MKIIRKVVWIAAMRSAGWNAAARVLMRSRYGKRILLIFRHSSVSLKSLIFALHIALGSLLINLPLRRRATNAPPADAAAGWSIEDFAYLLISLLRFAFDDDVRAILPIG
ncbi:hypothetical protein [Sphingomonas sp.]|uniref:hypothetical protein n=1 Tax=Sphingomonas sp. TaxID=28214 RepID=UPI00286D283F|nr:hypothetical protein [Sphingomonas sp.]